MNVTLLTVRLRMETAGGVTGTETRDNDRNRLPLRREPNGKVHLPGSTVAGSLRAHVRCHARELDEALFGDTPSREREDDNRLRIPSAIQVLGTEHRRGGGTNDHTRTAIDRNRGAARKNAFHVVEQLPPGTEFDIYLRWNNPDDKLTRFFELLKTWRPRLGRGVTRGSGRCVLTYWGRTDYDLTTPEGLLAWLQHDYPTPDTSIVSGQDHTKYEALQYELSIVDALLCGGKDEEDSKGRLVRQHHKFGTAEQPTYWIPGSTLKGILRSRAEYICRVVGASACAHQQCGNCRPCKLFGYSNPEKSRRATLIVEDADITDHHESLRPHVAIDRFSGGALDTALYHDNVLDKGRFQLRIQPLKGLDDADKLLLNAVLDDLHEGLIGIGTRTTVGYGTVQITDWKTPELKNLAALLREEMK